MTDHEQAERHKKHVTGARSPVECVLCIIEERDALAAQLAERERALREIGKFAAAHHDEQEAHVYLHALTVDIPDQVERALAATHSDSEREDG